jgi:predicted DNA-binding transcriptional regulator AlpA
MKTRTQPEEADPSLLTFRAGAIKSNPPIADVPLSITGGNDISDGGMSARERNDLFWSLLQRMGINTLLVSIPTIARALGYSPATLYGYISKGTFFLPHRMVNGSPMVAVDDLVSWLSSRRLDAQDGQRRSRNPSIARAGGNIRGLERCGPEDREAQAQTNDMMKRALRVAARAKSNHTPA